MADTPLQRSRDAKFDLWFRDRHWRVMTEESGDRTWDGEDADGNQVTLVVHYDSGHFVIDQPGVFQTPLGHKGRAGFIIRETDAEGADLPGNITAAFGRAALERAIERYGAVTGLPAA